MTRAQESGTQEWRGEIPIESAYTAGLGGQAFFKALKETGTLVATRCTPCRQVYLPARRFCERCFAELTDEVQVKPEGTIKSFSFCHRDHDGRCLERPLAAALIQLEGTTTVMLHRILGVKDESRLFIGSRAKAVIKPKAQRVGSILDIDGFRLIE